MAINPESQYPGQIAPSTAAYPYGSARNITTPGDGTGTPWEQALVNDIFGMQQELLSEASIVPSGSPEEVGASQYVQAMRLTSNFKDARAFGVVPNSSSDQVTEIQAALDSTGIIFLPPGTYRVSAPLVIPSDTFLIGAGMGLTIIRPHLDTGHEHNLIINYRASQTSGTTLDTDIGVGNLQLDGLSTDPTVDDGRIGYGIEIYGAERVRINNIYIKDMPLSGIEISGDKAAIAYGVRTGTTPLKTIDTIVENIVMSNVGFQEQNLVSLAERELLWGDAGFGVIARAPARNVTFRNIVGRGVQFGVAGVGQLSNLNDSSKTGDNLAQVIDANITMCFSDQDGFTVLAPAFRAAFCRNVSMFGLMAINSTGTQGISCRQAGQTWVQNVSVNGCHSSFNQYGVIANSASNSELVENISITGSHCYRNTLDGILVEDIAVTVTGNSAYNNGRHGIYADATDTPNNDSNSTIVGNVAYNNGQSSSPNSGIRVTNAQRTLVVGNQAFDRQAVPTQEVGIEEVGTSDENNITGNMCYNNTNAQITILGASTIRDGNSPHTPPVMEATEDISTGAIAAPADTRVRLVNLNSETPGAADSLTDITGGELGQIIVLKTNSNSEDITVEDATGNIRLNGNFTLTNLDDTLTLILRDPGIWSEVTRSDNTV